MSKPYDSTILSPFPRLRTGASIKMKTRLKLRCVQLQSLCIFYSVLKKLWFLQYIKLSLKEKKGWFPHCSDMNRGSADESRASPRFLTGAAVRQSFPTRSHHNIPQPSCSPGGNLRRGHRLPVSNRWLLFKWG